MFFCFIFTAAAAWHLLRAYEQRVSGLPWYHVRVCGGGVVYQDYWTTNPPPTTAHAEAPWYESLTNFPAR